MLELILTRGIPASGKSTFAKAWVLAGKNRVRINRDDIRMQLFNKEFGVNEDAVTAVEDAMVEAALKAGNSVIVDDCNIMKRYINRLAAIGHRYGAQVMVKQFDIPVETALERNAQRDRVVPESVIRDMHKRLNNWLGGYVENPLAIEKYVPVPGKRKAILVDIDGTLAKMVNRGPFEWHRVEEDEPVDTIIDIVDTECSNGTQIIVMSGRDGSCRAHTERWLDKHGIFHDALFMRAAGDMRKDSIVKLELFNEHIRDEYDVKYVLDDRDQVVDMWRALGLTCLQVAPGDF
ncbi:ATPase [Streptomyces phage Muntaha]|uniref:Polynucleotide kinase n=1 Tax=Streptomyces phage Muntaha TaxID=2713269 RepID=A0A6G8R3D1_9CAUD|nr:ATPase [Streptomyces phage Muntaha]QIN94709.1 polynucleotide kinase [Streptomyces phage Muntaha]